jgi:hypothetical protein
MVHVDPIKRANISHDKDVGKVEDGWVGAKPKFRPCLDAKKRQIFFA